MIGTQLTELNERNWTNIKFVRSIALTQNEIELQFKVRFAAQVHLFISMNRSFELFESETTHFYNRTYSERFVAKSGRVCLSV